MPRPAPQPTLDAAPSASGLHYGRFFLKAVAAFSLLGAVVLGVAPLALSAPERLALIGTHGMVGALAASALRVHRRASAALAHTLLGVGVLYILSTGLDVWVVKAGLRSPVLGFCGLVVFTLSAILGARAAVWLGACAIAQDLALAWAESHGWIEGYGAPTPLGVALVVQCLLVVCAAVSGARISQLLEGFVRSAVQREQHVRGLLRIAADWYWEQDREFRFTHVSHANDPAPDGTAHAARQRPLWEVSELGLGEQRLDAYRADLEAHRPFSGVLARHRDDQGRWRTLSLSGQPRFDAHGVFIGYWGVARDVTREVRAERAVAASETRYRELFARSPSPLFLHRSGIVFDANDAAARLFGFPDATAMNGFNILNLYAGEMREAAEQRMAEMERLPVGQGLAVRDYQIRSLDARTLHVQSTAVRVDTSSGPANLSIIFDITARKAAEGALRRSEALLSHLFATSPDCITLTDLHTGRYAMVNPAFCRLFGYEAGEVVGRCAIDIGLWHDPQDRQRMLELLAAHGSVSSLSVVFRAKSGALVTTLLSVGRFVMDERDYLVVNVRDVTDVERTRLQHTAILERASIGIAFTRERRFAQTNPFFERMFGWAPGTLIGQPAQLVWADEADYREIGKLAGPLLSRGQPFEAERRMRRQDGTWFWCRLLAQAVDRNEPSRGGTIWIAEDVTERRRLDEALGAARDAAEAASQAKSAFLANTSHEIRTPLNGLLGLARLALQADLEPERREQYLAQILDCAQSLAEIMSDILDVSKIEAGKITLEDTPFDLRHTLHAVHHAYESLADVKGLELRLSVADNVASSVRGDPVRVRQILSNFTTNALKFTERGQVLIHASVCRPGEIRLAVSDSGPGVSVHTQAQLFQPFFQGDSSTTRRYGGTGLGLSICRELAQLMGGRVGVDSAPGAGSTFWAELPLPAVAPAAAVAASSESQDVERLRGARVLMAEDNPVNMMIGVALLERWGLQVAQAVDGQAAVDAVHEAQRCGTPFDAVLMDVQMPVMSGHEAARALRQAYASATLPIVALTAAALVSERDEALEAGMDAFLTKPIDAAKLRSTLVRLVQRSAPVAG